MDAVTILLGILSTVVVATVLLGGFVIKETTRRVTALETMAIEVAKNLATLTEQGRNVAENLNEISKSIKTLPCREYRAGGKERCDATD